MSPFRMSQGPPNEAPGDSSGRARFARACLARAWGGRAEAGEPSAEEPVVRGAIALEPLIGEAIVREIGALETKGQAGPERAATRGPCRAAEFPL